MTALSGYLPVYKEKGMTSHDVVFKARRLLKTKKIGHTGTLDPNAEGVLVLCVGRATRMAEFLTGQDKTYEAEIILGRATDTDDITGTCIDERTSSVTASELIAALKAFKGDLMQVPPMYSALKKDGRKLYEYARQGKILDLPPRPVKIHEIHVLDLTALPHSATFRVSCSKGTYIRALCRDIGMHLGIPACMGNLKRIAQGEFRQEDTLTLGQIEQKLNKGISPAALLLPVDYGMDRIRSVHANERGKRFLRSGNKLYPWNAVENYSLYREGELLKLYDADGFAGMGKLMCDEENPYIKPIKIIPGD